MRLARRRRVRAPGPGREARRPVVARRRRPAVVSRAAVVAAAARRAVASAHPAARRGAAGGVARRARQWPRRVVGARLRLEYLHWAPRHRNLPRRATSAARPRTARMCTFSTASRSAPPLSGAGGAVRAGARLAERAAFVDRAAVCERNERDGLVRRKVHVKHLPERPERLRAAARTARRQRALARARVGVRKGWRRGASGRKRARGDVANGEQTWWRWRLSIQSRRLASPHTQKMRCWNLRTGRSTLERRAQHSRAQRTGRGTLEHSAPPRGGECKARRHGRARSAPLWGGPRSILGKGLPLWSARERAMPPG